MEDQLEHLQTIARTLDQQNQQLQRAFEIMYPFIIKFHGKAITKSEAELLLTIKFPGHGKTL